MKPSQVKLQNKYLNKWQKTGEDPKQFVENNNLIQISDPKIILPIIDEIIAKNQDNVEKYKAGNNKLLGFFVGQVIKTTKGKANPKIVNKLVEQQLAL